VVYASYQLGNDIRDAERTDALGRPFTDATEARLRQWLCGLNGVAQMDTWGSGDQAQRAGVAWFNVLARRTVDQP
jgi:hypothetical protein